MSEISCAASASFAKAGASLAISAMVDWDANDRARAVVTTID
jgi:hypothetical protein